MDAAGLAFSTTGVPEEGAALIHAAQIGAAASIRDWQARGGDINASFRHVRRRRAS